MPNLDRRILAGALLVVASAIVSPRAGAQEAPSSSGGGGAAAAADSLPFRAGQWGADFAINDGAVGLGVLRFRSPRMAWALNASIDARWSSADYTRAPDGFPEPDGDANALSFALRAGPRWYHPVVAGVATYLGTGVTGQIGRTSQDVNGFESRGWDVGGFGEVGAAYFVTRRLSLGAQTGVYATYGRSTSRSDQPLYDRELKTTQVGITPVRILGALYF